MYFDTKSYSKSNRNHTAKHFLRNSLSIGWGFYFCLFYLFIYFKATKSHCDDIKFFDNKLLVFYVVF